MQERIDELQTELTNEQVERKLAHISTKVLAEQRDAARALADQLAEACQLAHSNAEYRVGWPAYKVQEALAAYEARDWK